LLLEEENKKKGMKKSSSKETKFSFMDMEKVKL